MKRDHMAKRLMFAGVGLLFAIVGIFVLVWTIQNNNKAVEVDAVISQVKTTRSHSGSKSKSTTTAYVNYVYEGERYTDVPMGYYDFTMEEGKHIKALIDPDNPGVCYGTGSLILPIVFICFGSIFVIIGLFVSLEGKTVNIGPDKSEEFREKLEEWKSRFS